MINSFSLNKKLKTNSIQIWILKTKEKILETEKIEKYLKIETWLRKKWNFELNHKMEWHK